MATKLRNGRYSIPTTYNGTEFASKLEADWARFFDNFQIPWQYEPEAVYVGDTFIYPDFRLTMGSASKPKTVLAQITDKWFGRAVFTLCFAEDHCEVGDCQFFSHPIIPWESAICCGAPREIVLPSYPATFPHPVDGQQQWKAWAHGPQR